jgi:hypothetical protein
LLDSKPTNYLKRHNNLTCFYLNRVAGSILFTNWITSSYFRLWNKSYVSFYLKQEYGFVGEISSTRCTDRYIYFEIKINLIRFSMKIINEALNCKTQIMKWSVINKAYLNTQRRLCFKSLYSRLRTLGKSCLNSSLNACIPNFKSFLPTSLSRLAPPLLSNWSIFCFTWKQSLKVKYQKIPKLMNILKETCVTYCDHCKGRYLCSPPNKLGISNLFCLCQNYIQVE